MDVLLVKMRFRGNLHLGEISNLMTYTSDIIHCDTLFSAIINVYSLIFGLDKTNLFLENVIANPDFFRISSAFFYYNDGAKDVLLVPKPLGISISNSNDSNDSNNSYDYKRFKKLKFIPLDFLLNGDLKLLFNFLDILDIKKSNMEKTNMDKRSIEKKSVLYKEEERPRVSIDRVTNSSNIYYISSISFPEGVGMWFFMIVDNAVLEEIKTVIRVLGDEGIGGERTYGFGLFEPSFENYSIPDYDSNKYYNTSLSLVNPSQDEVNMVKYYSIITRKGYIYSAYINDVRYGSINVFSEGSVFSDKVNGRILDVTPDFFTKHRVFKYYRAFCIPVSKSIFEEGDNL